MMLLNLKKRICLAATIWLAVSSQVATASDVEIRTPDNARLAWVSTDLNQSGMQLSIQTFNSPDPIDTVFEFYRDIWFVEGDVPGFVEDDMGEWKLISQLREEHNIVLQLKHSPQGGSEGFLSVATKTHGSAKPNLDFPVPERTERFSSTIVEENDTEATTMTFISEQDISSLTGFYKDNLKRKGWQMAREDEIDGSQIMLFNRRGDRCELVVSKLNNEASVIYVNRVKRDG